MKCPECGAETVRQRIGIVYLTLPVSGEERDWCGCGWRGAWEKWTDPTPEEEILNRWLEANKVKK